MQYSRNPIQHLILRHIQKGTNSVNLWVSETAPKPQHLTFITRRSVSCSFTTATSETIIGACSLCSHFKSNSKTKKSESRSDLTEFSDTLARPLQYQTCVCVCVLYLCSVRSFLVVETVSALISSILTCFDGFSFGLSDFTDNICPSLS